MSADDLSLKSVVLAFYGAPKYRVRLNPTARDGHYFELVQVLGANEEQVDVVQTFEDLDAAEAAAAQAAADARMKSVLDLFKPDPPPPDDFNIL